MSSCCLHDLRNIVRLDKRKTPATLATYWNMYFCNTSGAGNPQLGQNTCNSCRAEREPQCQCWQTQVILLNPTPHNARAVGSELPRNQCRFWNKDCETRKAEFTNVPGGLNSQRSGTLVSYPHGPLQDDPKGNNRAQRPVKGEALVAHNIVTKWFRVMPTRQFSNLDFRIWCQ